MRIGIIGTGTIASAVVRGIVGDGHDIVVSERGARHSQALAQQFESVRIAPNQTVLDESDVILLGLPAEAAPAVLPPLRFDPRHRVISFMAGASLQQVAPWVAPAGVEALVLPFPAIAHGGFPVLSLGKSPLVESIFGRRNTVVAVQDPSELAAYLCAQAILSPVAQMVATAATWLGARTPDPDKGEAFLRMLVTTGLQADRADALVAALNTPGGYNQRLRQHLEQAGVTDALTAGLDRLSGLRG